MSAETALKRRSIANDMQAITMDFDRQIVRIEPEGFPTAGTYRRCGRGIARHQKALPRRIVRMTPNNVVERPARSALLRARRQATQGDAALTPLQRCNAGSSISSGAPITTPPPSHSPTRWRASSGSPGHAHRITARTELHSPQPVPPLHESSVSRTRHKADNHSEFSTRSSE